MLKGGSVDNHKATLLLTTKVWVKGGARGVDVRVAVVMVWSSLALEGMDISVGGGGFAAAATEKCMRWKIVGARIPWKH